ncbi:hypothetical protein [Tolumonas auensis]|jgi:hypothetical protein|uniref:hypothetical protein n=1 Tax=Tolumonas auensis TaxID=43948 RepID=UPI0002D6E661|nr:hypothetical protein [Tolumonas auensis]
MGVTLFFTENVADDAMKADMAEVASAIQRGKCCVQSLMSTDISLSFISHYIVIFNGQRETG